MDDMSNILTQYLYFYTGVTYGNFLHLFWKKKKKKRSAINNKTFRADI